MYNLSGLGISLTKAYSFNRLDAWQQPSSITDGPRVTVTGHRTDSFSGFNGLMFQAMFEMPFSAGINGENHDHEQPIGPDDPVPTLPIPPELVVQASEFFQSLTAEAQDAVMSSPTLVNQLATFLSSGGKIEIDQLPEGIGARFHEEWGGEGAAIVISDQIMSALNSGEYYRIEKLIGAVSHELGHAMTKMDGFELDVSDRQEYIESGYMNEAYAVLNSMLVVHEVTEAGVANIVPMLILSGGNDNGVYEALYDQFSQDAGLDALLEGVVDHLRALPDDPYGEFYGDDWDNRFGGN